MKYTRLTKEQFEALSSEFATFLAAQSIDKPQWDDIKTHDSTRTDELLDLFSDLIWEGVLNGAEYLEHYSEKHVFLFHLGQARIESVVIKVLDDGVNLLDANGMTFLREQLFSDLTEIRRGSKPYASDRNADIFSLIQQGAVLSDGNFYTKLSQILDS